MCWGFFWCFESVIVQSRDFVVVVVHFFSLSHLLRQTHNKTKTPPLFSCFWSRWQTDCIFFFRWQASSWEWSGTPTSWSQRKGRSSTTWWWLRTGTWSRTGAGSSALCPSASWESELSLPRQHLHLPGLPGMGRNAMPLTRASLQIAVT